MHDVSHEASHELTTARRSVRVFGIYLLGLAFALIAVPNLLLALFGVPATQEVWIRVVGMLAGFLGYYYVRLGSRSERPFLEMTIQVRLSVPAFFLAFVLFVGAPWQLLLFAGIDVLGAGWTWWSVRGSARPAAATARSSR